MRVVLTDLWENERRVSFACQIALNGDLQSSQAAESVTGKGDRSERKVSYDLVREGWGAGHARHQVYQPFIKHRGGPFVKSNRND